MWEGVGVCSYLLVSFWFTRIAANQSSLSAFLTNRVGDAFLTIGMLILLWSLGNLDYSIVFSLAPYINENIITIIGICLLIGAMAKSSQVGLHIWLPMAMEGLLNRALLKLHYMREHPVLNSWSSVYLDFGKIQEEGQSAGNSIKGSSETTCEAVNINDEFKWWFIGFTEGDGSFIVNKSGYLEFKVTQSSIDAQILFFIKKELGFGSVSVQDKVNKTHHYRIRDKKNIHKLIQIFNGNIVTNYKFNQFKVWVNAFNEIYKTNVQCIENKHELTLNNAWLSGFTDAEGCFTCSTSVSKSTGKAITTVRYVISQKGDIDFSRNLADKINGYVTYVKSYNGYNTVVNFGKLNKILLYLKSYPLKTKKFISYTRWLKIYGLVKDKKHLTHEGRIIIKFLSKLIN